MFYLKANEEHLEKGSSICIFPEREEKKKNHTHTHKNKQKLFQQKMHDSKYLAVSSLAAEQRHFTRHTGELQNT